MKTTTPEIAILGDGGWGTTLAILLSAKGYRVTLWGAFPEYLKTLRSSRENTKFLPGFKIPASVKIVEDIGQAVKDKKIVVLAAPSQHLRSVLRAMKKSGYPRNAYFVSVTKGIETGSLKRMSEVVHEELGPVKLAVLSGPTIAHEVAAGIPSTAVIASHSSQMRKMLQHVFMTERFRIYTSDDVIGVEFGGSLKNVIAIACGIADGMGFGSNSKAALLSRGLAEMARLGHKLGANMRTFSGISGLGDLVTTCVSGHSRNRHVGEEIGRGKTYAQIKRGMQMVAEGVPTAQSAHELSVKHKVDMPICKEVYQVLYRNKPAKAAVRDLMTRSKKAE